MQEIKHSIKSTDERSSRPRTIWVAPSKPEAAAASWGAQIVDIQSHLYSKQTSNENCNYLSPSKSRGVLPPKTRGWSFTRILVPALDTERQVRFEVVGICRRKSPKNSKERMLPTMYSFPRTALAVRPHDVEVCLLRPPACSYTAGATISLGYGFQHYEILGTQPNPMLLQLHVAPFCNQCIDDHLPIMTHRQGNPSTSVLEGREIT